MPGEPPRGRGRCMQGRAGKTPRGTCGPSGLRRRPTRAPPRRPSPAREKGGRGGDSAARRALRHQPPARHSKELRGILAAQAAPLRRRGRPPAGSAQVRTRPPRCACAAAPRWFPLTPFLCVSHHGRMRVRGQPPQHRGKGRGAPVGGARRTPPPRAVCNGGRLTPPGWRVIGGAAPRRREQEGNASC